MDREDREILRAIRKGCMSIYKEPGAREAQRVQAAKILARANGLSFGEQWKRLNQQPQAPKLTIT